MARISRCYLTLRARVRVGFAHWHYCTILTRPAELSVRPDLMRQLVPPHTEPELRSRAIELDNFVPIPLEDMKITLD